MDPKTEYFEQTKGPQRDGPRLRARRATLALVSRLGMSFDHSETAEFKGAACSEAHFVLRR